MFWRSERYAPGLLRTRPAIFFADFHPYFEWVLRPDVVKPNRGEQANDAAGCPFCGLSEGVELRNCSIGWRIEPAA